MIPCSWDVRPRGYASRENKEFVRLDAEEAGGECCQLEPVEFLTADKISDGHQIDPALPFRTSVTHGQNACGFDLRSSP